MKPITTILLLTILNTILYAQHEPDEVLFSGEFHYVYTPSLRVDTWSSHGNFSEYDIPNIDGKWIQFFQGYSDKIARVFEIKHGDFHGDFICFNIEGQIIEKSTYILGKTLNYFSWYDNGRKKDSIIYIIDSCSNFDNIRIAFRESFYENGKPECVENYNQQGCSNGTWFNFYDNGIIKRKYNYKPEVWSCQESFYNSGNCGVLEGTYEIFHPNSQLRWKFKYRNDTIIDSTYTEYYPSGSVKQTGRVKNGFRTGLWICYYENGKIQSQGMYEINTYDLCDYGWYGLYESKVGPWEYYYRNGMIMAAGEYNKAIKYKSYCGRNGRHVYCGAFNNTWEFYDSEGKNTNIRKLIKGEYIRNEEVYFRKLPSRK